MPNLNDTNKDNDTVQLQTFVPYRMVHLAANISLALSKIYKQEFDITIAQWRVLAQLAEHKKLYSKDIGAVTSMDKSKVSRAVKVLETKKLIQRQIDKVDQRAAYLSLTKHGQALYLQIAPKALQWEQQLLSSLQANERKHLMNILNKLDKQAALTV